LAVAAIDLAGERCAEGLRPASTARRITSRVYNVIEQMARRVAEFFENSVGDERGWHAELIRRLSIRSRGEAAVVRKRSAPALQSCARSGMCSCTHDLTIDQTSSP
jgi:hypothetical protein